MKKETEDLCDFRVSKIFLDVIPKTKLLKKKRINWALSKLRESGLQKRLRKWKRNKLGKNVANKSYFKKVLKTCKQHTTLKNNKLNNPILKMGQRFEHTSCHERDMDNK